MNSMDTMRCLKIFNTMSQSTVMKKSHIITLMSTTGKIQWLKHQKNNINLITTGSQNITMYQKPIMSMNSMIMTGVVPRFILLISSSQCNTIIVTQSVTRRCIQSNLCTTRKTYTLIRGITLRLCQFNHSDTDHTQSKNLLTICLRQLIQLIIMMMSMATLRIIRTNLFITTTMMSIITKVVTLRMLLVTLNTASPCITPLTQLNMELKNISNTIMWLLIAVDNNICILHQTCRGGFMVNLIMWNQSQCTTILSICSHTQQATMKRLGIKAITNSLTIDTTMNNRTINIIMIII